MKFINYLVSILESFIIFIINIIRLFFFSFKKEDKKRRVYYTMSGKSYIKLNEIEYNLKNNWKSILYLIVIVIITIITFKFTKDLKLIFQIFKNLLFSNISLYLYMYK